VEQGVRKMTLKVLAACGQGLGSCQIITMKLNSVFKKMGIEAKVTSSNVSMAKSTATSYDVLFCGQTLLPNFKAAESKGVVLIGLKNIVSEKEMEEKIQEAIACGKIKTG
jgi:PTS system ascorbate-specific IIB component